MEEAYTALYQEFIRLQSLCLKQTAMLHHLTEALRRKQGVAPVSNEDHEGMASMPIQCTNEDANLPYCDIPTLAATTLALGPHSKVEADSFPIAGAMERLQLDPTGEEKRLNNHDHTVPVENQHSTRQPSIVEELRQAQLRGHNSQTSKNTRRPWSSSFMTSEMLSQAGGMWMSRVTLQSQVCEFCQAVFPGHTTTRGEFVRHLMTHTD